MSLTTTAAYALILLATGQWAALALKVRKGSSGRVETVRKSLAAGAGMLIARILIQWDAVLSIWLWVIPVLAGAWALWEIGSRWTSLPRSKRLTPWSRLAAGLSAVLLLGLVILLVDQTWLR
jgi:hypothetical protein